MIMGPWNYQLHDYVEMKKEHPCAARSTMWQIVRMGADIKMKCLGCGTLVMLSRFQFERRLKKVLGPTPHPLPATMKK
jgi:hypothetical protein